MEFMKLSHFIFQFSNSMYDSHKLPNTPYQPKNPQLIFYDNILILKLFFSKITNKKMESKFTPKQNLTKIYNPRKSHNLLNIYDNTDKFPYVAVKSFYNFDKDTPLSFHNQHIFLETLNLIYSYVCL